MRHRAIQQHIEGSVFFMDGRIKCGHGSGFFRKRWISFTRSFAGMTKSSSVFCDAALGSPPSST
jgi:hypothetical protein